MSSRYYAEIDLEQTNNTHASLVRLVGEGKRVLELGAASGYMTRMLKQRGCQVVAVEFDPAAIDELSSIADETVIGDLNDSALLDGISGPFDVVLAGDVLEHLLDPLAVLRAVVDKLGPDGEVVISIPNVGHVDLRLALFQGHFDYRETGLLDDTHIRFFTRETFTVILRAAGLVAVDLERTVVRVFESELAVPGDSVSDQVLAEAMKVPESETYQFVFRAIPATQPDAERRAAALEQANREFDADSGSQWETGEQGLSSLRGQAELLQSYLVTAERDRDLARERVATLSQELDQVRELLQHAERDREGDTRRVPQLESALAAANAETEGLRVEVAVARRELLAACISESSYTAVKSALDTVTGALTAEEAEFGVLNDGRSPGEIAQNLRQTIIEAQADQKELARIRSSRSYKIVVRYRQLAELVAPPGTTRHAVFLVLSRNRNRASRS